MGDIYHLGDNRTQLYDFYLMNKVLVYIYDRFVGSKNVHDDEFLPCILSYNFFGRVLALSLNDFLHNASVMLGMVEADIKDVDRIAVDYFTFSLNNDSIAVGSDINIDSDVKPFFLNDDPLRFNMDDKLIGVDYEGAWKKTLHYILNGLCDVYLVSWTLKNPHYHPYILIVKDIALTQQFERRIISEFEMKQSQLRSINYCCKIEDYKLSDDDVGIYQDESKIDYEGIEKILYGL